MMKKKLLLILMFIAGYSALYAQETDSLEHAEAEGNIQSANNIFLEIETAMASADVAKLAQHFSPQTYFSLSSGVNGYYSSNQAFYLMADFFKIYKSAGFRFNNVKAEENNPYATGIYQFESKGKRDTAQVYVSLKKIGNNWKIIQITIN